METKALRLELKALPAEGSFEGYAATFGNVDLGGDVIEVGAFSKTLPRFLAKGKVLYQHDSWRPIGLPTQASEDSKGLYVQAQLSLDNPTAAETYGLLKDGVIDSLSIGYDVRSSERIEGEAAESMIPEGANPRLAGWIRDYGIRKLLDLDLWEFSPVTFPMNPEAEITSVKQNSAVTGAPAALTFAAEAEAALAAVDALSARFGELAALKRQDNRRPGAASRGAIEDLAIRLTEAKCRCEALLRSASCVPAGQAAALCARAMETLRATG